MTPQKMMILGTKGRIAAVVQGPEIQTGQLAILCPGYLDSKEYPHLVGLAETLVGMGYTTVRFDPAGTWESDGEITDYTTTQYLKDVHSVIDHFMKDGRYQELLLGGHSRGGGISILAAARDPRISRVLGVMPSTLGTITGPRYEEWKEKGFSISRRRIPGRKNEEREYRVPYAHVEDRARYDVVEEVKKVQVPLFLLAGETDDLVLPEYVKEIYDRANEPKFFVTIPGIGHDYQRSEKEVEIIDAEVKKMLSGHA
jgi:pimeloyl-ACP methyl ester carboxylesterase